MTDSSRQSAEGTGDGAEDPSAAPGDGPASPSPGANEDAGLPADRTLGDVDDEQQAQDQMIVLPPPKDDDPTWRRRRSRGLPWWVLIPVVLLGAYGLYEAGQRGWFDVGGQAAQARSETSQVRAAAAERAEATRRFRQTADSLRTALEGYEVRQSDFEQNRIDCASLASGHRRVDRHFVSLSVHLRERGDRLDAEARTRYEELTTRVDSVNRHFDGTECRAGG